jgi:hypothetical protein
MYDMKINNKEKEKGRNKVGQKQKKQEMNKLGLEVPTPVSIKNSKYVCSKSSETDSVKIQKFNLLTYGARPLQVVPSPVTGES